MDNNINLWIKLKEYINNEEYKSIKNLEKICEAYDKTALKLELDYKLNISINVDKSTEKINEFMYYNGCDLIAYLGISNYGGSSYEVNGMVHPNYRRNRIFSKLFQLVKQELEIRNARQILLLSDRESLSGQSFIKATGSNYKNSEYEMYLNMDFKSTADSSFINDVVLRKATNEDAKEVARQNSIYFDGDYDESDMIMPEEEEKLGMTIYLAEVDNKIIGKVNLQIENNLGAIYGLGVLPEYRSKGYGRKILLKGINSLKAKHVENIMLQVAVNNSNALNLYKSCGFEETSIMDYYSRNSK